MCGIVGFVRRQAEPALLHDMMNRVRHRGPDGAGEWHGEREGWHVSLGHRRLAIIDVKGGKQPMTTEDNALALTYNGEVYNYPRLRSQLEDFGHRFTTRSDTEVVLNHLEEHGENGLADLNGMFALALWNNDTGELLLARDRAGIKPLYYTSLPDGGIAFASELSALLEDRRISRELSVEGLARYFFSDYTQPPGTIIDGINKLEPGHAVVWRNGHLRESEPYWELGDVLPHTPMRGRGELAVELWERLGTAVRRQLVSDVPVGVFSGRSFLERRSRLGLGCSTRAGRVLTTHSHLLDRLRGRKLR
jgi:asparagine synthase (glutamine-hydrolysing)